MDQKTLDFLATVPDDVLAELKFSVPWQYNASEDDYSKDPDGFKPTTFGERKETESSLRDTLQNEIWSKFHRNPWINTSTRGLMGRLTGWGFETTSEIFDIQEAIDEIELDPRNRLYDFWPKYVGRTTIEGELYLILTVHPDGFIEVDFVDPGLLSYNGDEGTGIIFHPDKPTMPLFYNITPRQSTNLKKGIDIVNVQIPSIFVARYPELAQVAANNTDYNRSIQQKARSRKGVYKDLGGYFRFVISWNKGLVTRRAVSHLRTVLEWLNHYENLKKYEIDHKKSSGAYLWVFSFDDVKSFKLWLTLTDEERKKTGVMAKKTPGSSLITPPGMTVQAINPNLTSLKEQDTDILQMVSSGLNEPSDITTGTSKGTFASVKASRGPFSDRTSDEIAYFDRFLKFDFWSSVFFLKSAVSEFPKLFEIEEAIGFGENQKPKFKKVKRAPERLIDVSYPISEVANFEGRARGLLGVKHGPVSESLGIPNSSVAKIMGIGGYGRNRLRKALEDKKYPKLVYNLDAESLQEKAEAEPGKKKPAKPKE